MRAQTGKSRLHSESGKVAEMLRGAIPVPTRRQALEQAKRMPGFPGICAECGCTERNACTNQGFLEDETCGWANKERTLCTNPECMEKAAAKR